MTFSGFAGYGNSDLSTFTIGNGADGSAVAPVDLGRQYAFIVIRCEDVSNAASPSDTLAIKVSVGEGDPVLAVKDDNGAVTHLMDTEFHRPLFVGVARRVQLVLSANASGGSVVIEVYGIDAAVVGGIE